MAWTKATTTSRFHRALMQTGRGTIRPRNAPPGHDPLLHTGPRTPPFRRKSRTR